jgi:hypothetical protein
MQFAAKMLTTASRMQRHQTPNGDIREWETLFIVMLSKVSHLSVLMRGST